LQPGFKQYQEQVVKNAGVLAGNLKDAGFDLVSGGTDNHLMLVDLTRKGITGKDAEIALEKAGITVNKNGIPFDTKPPTVTSGIRIGTPALTTRGMVEEDMLAVAEAITAALENMNDESVLAEIRLEVEDFAREFPLFAW
ncbi:MAG: serine hydroxymethyltransferase, partial [Desulfovibrio sp.]|nr:serine hydroxymethyltransferase [Desulfovibrio sp.]